ncbi:MAG: cytochrome c biogenesis protein CcsA [Desulfobulbus sp.]
MELILLSLPHIPLFWVLVLYGGAFVISCTGWRWALFLLLTLALASNFLLVLHRYTQAWPMLPMHLAPVLTPFLLACMLLIRLCLRATSEKLAWRAWQVALLAMVTCLLAAQLFPKDFYLPFLRSDSPFAHVTLVASAGGRACFVLSIAWGTVFFSASAAEERVFCMRQALLWAAWGFVLWTLSMFSGEMWSYLGWGTPVVWHDPAILLMMAVWFIYIGLLHLHFSRAWSLRGRASFAAVAGLLAVVLSLLADFGPYRPLWQ